MRIELFFRKQNEVDKMLEDIINYPINHHNLYESKTFLLYKKYNYIN